MSHNLIVTHPIPDKGIKMLQERFENVQLNPETGLIEKSRLIELVKDKDIIISLLSDAIDEELISSCPDLKLISNYAVGFNNIDLDAATKRGIYVTNTPRTLDDTTADFAIALMLSVARRIVESEKFMRSGKFKGWGAMDFLGGDVHHATLGIIGMGSIGKHVAKRGHFGFGMKILYVDEFVDESSLDLPARKIDLETLLKESDFVSLHVPLNEQTHHLIGEKELSMMKPDAYLINTSRGPVVNEEALYNALKENRIAGAGLDVYEFEPAFHKGLNELDNVVMCPHIASASINTRQNMSIKAAQNVLDFVDGKIPEGLVNLEVLK